MGESGGHGSLPWATVRPVLLELVARLSVKWMPSPPIACAEPRFIPRTILHDEDQRLSSGPAWIRTGLLIEIFLRLGVHRGGRTLHVNGHS